MCVSSVKCLSAAWPNLQTGQLTTRTEKFSKTLNSQRATRTRNFQKRESVKIRKIRKQHTKIRKPRIAQKAVKCGNNQRKSGKNKNKNKTTRVKAFYELAKSHVRACHSRFQSHTGVLGVGSHTKVFDFLLLLLRLLLNKHS